MFAKPSHACRVGALIPFILGGASLFLVSGASKASSMVTNPLALLLSGVVLLNFLLFFIPRIFRWDWNVRYFLVSGFQLGSIVMLGGVPWLCFLLYGSPPLALRGLAFLAYLAIIFLPSRRFIQMYADIRQSGELMRYLYQHDAEDDRYYYVQKNDVMLLEKKYKVSFFPPAMLFIAFALAAFAMIPFAGQLSALAGLPFAHLFMGIISIPLDIMSINFLVKAWLVFAHLPGSIGKRADRKVLVDMGSSATMPNCR